MDKGTEFHKGQSDHRLLPVFTSSQLNAYLDEIEKEKPELQEECDK
jgi:hypothetical protein